MTSEPQLRVLQIAAGDLWAGAEVQLFTLCKYLQPQIDLRVMLFNPGTLANKLKEQGITVVIADEATLGAAGLYQAVKKVVLEFQPDIIHTHREKENIIAGHIAQRAGIPSLRTLHGAQEHLPSWRKPHRLLVALLNRYSANHWQQKIVAVSKQLSELSSKEFSTDRLVTIENGVDTKALQPYRRLRRKILDSSIRVGIVGRLVPVKRIDRFIEVAELCLHNDLDCEFLIYGDGPLRDTIDLSIRQKGLQNHVKLEGHSEKIHSEIAALDFLMITSDHEGLPMVLLESMALGTPVIASSVGGIPEVLSNGQFGTLVSPLSAQGFYEALAHCLANPEQTQAVTEAAVSHVANHYSGESCASQYLALYQSINNRSEVS